MDEQRPAPASIAPTVAADPAAAAAVTAAAAAASPSDFEYFGGEFPDDAPFVESLHGLAAPGSAAAFGAPAGGMEAEGEGDRDDGGDGHDSGADGGGGDLDALLSSLMGGEGGGGDFGFGSGGSEWAGCSDPAGGEIFFRINAAASFAALVAPEEQTAEIDFSQMDAQTAAETVDALTPIELMQVGRRFTAGACVQMGLRQRRCALLSMSGCASTDSSFAR
jgi:hypothetical protein